MQRAGWLLGVLLILNSELRAQTTASIRVEVADLQGGPIAGADVRLENLLTGFRTSEVTDADGTVALSNIPLQRYTLTVAKTNFETAQQALELRSNVPQQVKIQLALGSTATSIQVLASDLYETVDPQATGTRSELNMAVISRVPAAPGTRGLETMLLSLPGFAANANGAIHPRGAHNQMTFVIDGMPISDQLTGAFANSVDPSMVQTIELFTGDIPAEFGNKVSGVAVITTRSGMGTGRALGGSIQLFGGGFDTAGQVTQVSGGGARWGYFSSLTTLKSNRYLDQVSRDNLHNGGNSERVFTRLDRELTQRSQLRVTAMAGRSSFQLANLRSQHAAGQDQRQNLRDAALSVGYLRSIGTSSTWDSTVSYRTSIAQLYGSEFDTPVTADQARHLSTFTAGTRFNRDGGWHVLRAGVDYQLFPVSENFSFGITDPTFNAPGSEGFVPTLLQHDISRGGSRFVFSGKDEGRLYSAFLQETLRFGPLTTSIGMRYDRYDFLSRGNQFQPRIGIAYHIRKTATVLRASYNRTYQTPPNENLLLASAEATARLVPVSVQQALGTASVLIRPERQNVLEAGLQQGLGRHLTVNAAVYHKNSRDMQDNDNFLNTGIILPTSLLRSRTNGAEVRLALTGRGRFSGSLSLTHFHTVVTPPFTGGLFLGSAAVDLLTAGPFVIDHDQKLGAHGLLQYNVRRNIWISGSVRYDSGLVSNPSDPEVVAADPDHSDLLPFVNLTSDPPRVRPRTIVDLAIGYEGYRRDRKAWDVVAQVNNIADTTALYNFQSIFVGTRLTPGRTASVKLRWFF